MTGTAWYDMKKVVYGVERYPYRVQEGFSVTAIVPPCTCYLHGRCLGKVNRGV